MPNVSCKSVLILKFQNILFPFKSFSCALNIKDTDMNAIFLTIATSTFAESGQINPVILNFDQLAWKCLTFNMAFVFPFHKIYH